MREKRAATVALQRIAKMTAFSMFNTSDPESTQNDEIVSEARSFSVIFMGGQTMHHWINSVLICSLQATETYDPCPQLKTHSGFMF